jgi:alpha-ketoglutarate-dependent taurine dioxygenase
MSGTASFAIAPLPASFGAIVTGLRLATINAAQFAALYAAWLDYALLVFPDQHLTNVEQILFAERFGALEFELAPISNVRKDGSLRAADGSDDVVEVLKGNMGWHSDSTYMPVQSKGAVFTAHLLPSSGGDTGWADMRAAYDALDVQTREHLADLSAYHSLHHSQAQIGHHPKSGYSGYGFHDLEPPLRSLVKRHPETDRYSLAIGRHAYGIVGMDADASAALLRDLIDAACIAPRIYHHQWAPGDAVLWDNRCLLHRATPWPMHEPRTMYHARIAGAAATETAQNYRGIAS